MTTALLVPLLVPGQPGHVHSRTGLIVFIAALVFILVVGGLMALRYLKK